MMSTLSTGHIRLHHTKPGLLMELETLIYEKADRIATLTLNRPEKSNALSVKLRDELDLVLDDLDRDDDTRVLIIKANGNHFSA